MLYIEVEEKVIFFTEGIVIMSPSFQITNKWIITARRDAGRLLRFEAFRSLRLCNETWYLLIGYNREGVMQAGVATVGRRDSTNIE